MVGGGYDFDDRRAIQFYVWVQSPDGSVEALYHHGSGDLLDINWQFEADRVPTCSFTIRNPPPNIPYRSNVQIAVQSVTFIMFRGVVLDSERTELGTRFLCVGRSWSLDVTYQTALGIFQSPITSEQAVHNMLGNAGIDDISTVDLPAWTMATNSSQVLTFGTWGDAIRKVIEVEDAHWYEDRVGNIHVSNLALVPAPVPVRTYFSMRTPVGIVEQYPSGITEPYRPRIRSGQRVTNIRATKNRVIAKGASVNTVNADGTTTSAPLTKEVSAPSPYVVKHDGTQDYSDFTMNNELVDTQAKVDEVAARYLAKLNILHEELVVVIDGDPRVALGQTVRIVDYDYIGVVGLYCIVGYQTTLSEGSFQTTLRLMGGTTITPNRDPVAVFTYRVEREVYDDQVFAFVTFDARASYDVDGEIASYSWADNQASDIATGSAPVFTVAVDPATLVVPWEVTLTVTDDSSPVPGTASFTLTVDISTDGPFTFLPAFTLAFDTRFSGTPDGGQTWYDQVGTDVVSTAAGDLSLVPGLAVYGTELGGIYRTTDYCLSAPTQVLANVGSIMVDLEWDRYRPNLVWGVTQGGRVYRSVDQGLTWTLWDNLVTYFGSADVRLNRVHSTPTGVRVYGALNDDLLIAHDKTLSHNWTQAAIGGELGEDMAHAPSDVYVADAAWNLDTELAIILNHSGGTIESGLSVAQGTYLGNGTSQSITNKGALGAEGAIGFTPRVVIVKANTAANSEALIRVEGMTSCRPLSAAAVFDQGISSLDTGGFSVLQTASVQGRTNAAGVTYHFWVLGGDALEIGTYTGNETARSFSGFGFPPVMVWVLATAVTGPDEMLWLSTSMEGRGGCLDFNAGDIDNLIDHITSLDADGFSIGADTEVNEDTEGFLYVGFKNVPNLALGIYAGDSVDGRDVPDTNSYTVPTGPLAFSPDLVTIKVETANNCVYRDRFLAGDLTFRYNSGAPLANKIQILNPVAGKWDVGTNVDVNVFAGGLGDPPTHFYHYFAFEDATGTPSLPLPTVYYTPTIDGDGDDWRRAVGQPNKTRGQWIAEDMEQGKFAFAYNDTANYLMDVSDLGVVNAYPAVATLDANDSPHHALFVGQKVIGMAGVYLVSAEGTADGTVYKTFDRFATIDKLRPATGYPASPAGANAYMTDLSKSLAPVGVDLIIARSPQFQDDTYPRQLADLTDGSWTYIVNPASVLQNIQADLRRIGGNLYRYTDSEYDSHTNGGSHVGIWERSTDGGVTWATMAGLPAHDNPGGGEEWGHSHKGPVADAAGNLWLPCGPNNEDRNFPAGLGPLGNDFPILYKSTDNGANWTSVFTDTGTETVGIRSFREVLVHPSDPNKIAIWGSYWLGGLYVWWSTDGGASFSLSDYSGSVAPDPDGGSGQDITELRWAVATSSGAVVFTLNIQYILRLNSWGAAVGSVQFLGTVRSSAQYFWGLGRTHNDMLIAHVRSTQDSWVLRSFDLGDTWEQMAVMDNAGLTNFDGLYYDPYNDALYYTTSRDSFFPGPGTSRVYRQADASKPFVGTTSFAVVGAEFAGTVIDLTLNLDSLFTGGGFGDERIGTRCITKGDAGGYTSPGVM